MLDHEILTYTISFQSKLHVRINQNSKEMKIFRIIDIFMEYNKIYNK